MPLEDEARGVVVPVLDLVVAGKGRARCSNRSTRLRGSALLTRVVVATGAIVGSAIAVICSFEANGRKKWAVYDTRQRVVRILESRAAGFLCSTLVRVHTVIHDTISVYVMR